MQRYDVDIDICPSCKGVWLDRGEIDKITRIQSNYDQHYNKYHYRKREYDDDDDDDDYDDYGGHYDTRRRKRGGFLGELFDLLRYL